MWIVKLDVDDVVVDCIRTVTCPMCGGLAKLLMSKLLNFDLVPGSGKRDAHAVDMEMRCQACGNWDTFGVPIDKRTYDRMSEMLNDSPLKDNYAESDTGLIRGMLINPDALGSDMSKKWEQSNDPVGHKPKFDIICYHCKQNDITEHMVLRYAYISPKEDATRQVYGALNQMEYKCPECEWTTKFLVEAPSDYLLKVQDMREKSGYHRNLFYLTPEEWSEHDAVKKKLESLGYF